MKREAAKRDDPEKIGEMAGLLLIMARKEEAKNTEEAVQKEEKREIGKTKLVLEHEIKQIESPLTRRRIDSIGQAATGNALAVSVRTITSV